MARDAAYWKAERRIEAARREGAIELDLSRMRLTEVPEAIGALTQLQTLDLSYNELTEVPEAIGALTQLKLFHLSYNRLRVLPKAISDLTQLRSIDLSDNQLAVLPKAIISLTQLQTLDLTDNLLAKLPETISSLTQLQTLVLGNNQLTGLPEAIGSLTQLQTLALFTNQLTALPEAIGSLTHLQTLVLADNQLTEVPKTIGSLTQLQELSLYRNQLTALPEVIGSLTQLQELSLFDNPLNSDLAAAYEQGTAAVLKYLRAQAEEKMALNEAKLILVGEGEVGKSCLLGALRGDEWVDGRPTTHGIEIKPVIVTAPDGETEITLNGWDFGGQGVYRPTHQLFFSAPAIYLVVWKPREGTQQGSVREWISLIKHREPDAKVLVVATHGGPRQRQPDIDRQELIDLFGSETVVGFFHVDSKPDEATQTCAEIAELRAAIAKIAANLPEMGRTVPAKWQRARETLQASDQPYLPYTDVIRLCADHGIDTQQAELSIQISHRLGHLTHYHHDPTLRDIVILKPDWLAKAISFVLDDKTTRQRNGLVEFDRLSHIWSHPPFPDEIGYPKELHPIFLALMERFDLSYKVVLDPTQPSTTSLIAQLVPDNRPALLPHWSDHPKAGDRQQEQICQIVDEERGLPATADGLFYRLIVRLHKYSLGRTDYKNSVHWQRGLMLDNDYNGRALLEQIGTEIKITVQAAYPDRFLSYLTEEIKWLVKDFWKGLECIEMVPCVAPCGRKQPGHGSFEVKRLIEYRSQGMTQFPCMVPGCFQLQNIDILMRNAPVSQQTSVEKLLAEELGDVKVRLDGIRKDIRTLDVREDQRFQHLDQNDRRILSQTDEQFAHLLQTLTDEAKDGPRLFSFKPVDPGFFDSPTWIRHKFQLTLWCEHSAKPLTALNPPGSTQGVIELTLSREWIAKSAPLLKLLFKTLSLVAPVAISGTQFLLDDPTYAGIKESLDLGQKSIDFASKAGDPILDWQTKSNAPKWESDEGIRAQGSLLRELHVLLKEKDPSFGRLVRVQNKRREFLWVHPQFVSEY